MSALMNTFGTIKKDTLVRINNVDMMIENVWKTYHAITSLDDKYPGVEFSSPNEEIKLMVFTGEKFISHAVKRLIRHKTYSCATDITLSIGFKMSIVDKCKLLSDDKFTDKLRKGTYVATPKELHNNRKSYSVDTHGDLYLFKITNVDFAIIDDYTYSFEMETYHNFVANGIVCGDFVENNT